MIGDGATGQPPGVSVVVLACTACQHVYQPDLADFGSGNTGCRRCGGWTWIAQLGATEWSAVTSNDQAAPQRGAGPGPAVTAPATPAGSGSPTISR